MLNSYYTHTEFQILSECNNFFTQDQLQTIIGINTGQSKLSLRIIDWFITMYAIINAPSIHREYVRMASIYGNRYFNPFRRQRKVLLGPTHTSIGQLNFFKWMFENNIMDYICDNIDDIIFSYRMNLIYKPPKY